MHIDIVVIRASLSFDQKDNPVQTVNIVIKLRYDILIIKLSCQKDITELLSNKGRVP